MNTDFFSDLDASSPTLEPSAEPSQEPSAEPTAEPTIPSTTIPTVIPTTVPTQEPSAQPTISPTIMPTIIPAVVPTVNPSISPSRAPTKIPTTGPTVIPTAAPSTVPSAAPTASPTGPTYAPSRSPTCKPTRTPTAAPTVRPTPLPGDPTLAPTPSPTVTPTLRPTRSPTYAPSIQVTPIVTFDSSLTLSGLTSNTLSTSGRDSVVSVTASSMGVSKNTVSFVSETAIANNRRKLSTSEMTLFSTTYTILAVTRVDIPLSSTIYATTTELYNTLTNKLDSAVKSGNFTTELILSAQSNNASELFTAEALNVTNTAAIVEVPSLSGNTNSSEDLSTGGIAGIVIGGFFFLVLTGMFLYYMLIMKSGFVKVTDSSVVERSRAEQEKLDHSQPGQPLMSIVP